uniref:Uncharacterized protein n=1 Tax=Rhizophora mucronata TaxID=61149 RepID=A0A2P2NUT4_RHIMU
MLQQFRLTLLKKLV